MHEGVRVGCLQGFQAIWLSFKVVSNTYKSTCDRTCTYVVPQYTVIIHMLT
jgi:hypothetical protein